MVEVAVDLFPIAVWVAGERVHHPKGREEIGGAHRVVGDERRTDPGTGHLKQETAPGDRCIAAAAEANLRIPGRPCRRFF